ncbi:Stk1 family PASTA domain-containing Ser/Thr kinase [Lactobacillus taiwanensis]|uniref:Stk1 family PASTA domain-containing Ser/Thr kinase n=1 Tax=Lactobacillus taiwanensis TaxID=508451 RepID=UPI0025A930DC|nr:Stk1 family PASTA domain-containing Ser/Thr kinase [Lactobacillus taiwanensis]
MEKDHLLGGRYKIISVLGEGGMANVYLAEDIILQRKVAVKVLRLDLQKDPQTIQRFQREALSTSELSHPHIVSILDVGTEGDRHYLVMDYVDGPDLEKYIQHNSPIPLPKVIDIMDQILSAVALAHKHNVIHRDLKPQNILMDKKGNIKIVDFGIAIALNQSTMTQTNTAMGSVHYMSPEQARGSMATKQSDIYSLGIILYKLLTGSVPFTGENAVTVALKHFQEKTPSLRDKNPAIPQALENVVFKATAKDPRDRYKSVIEMKEDLDTSLDPKRKDEPVFKPQHDPSADETIVIPPLEGSVHNKDHEVKKQEEPQEEKKGLLENLKGHTWWWLGAVIAFCAIMIILFFALGRKDMVDVPSLNKMSQTQAKSSLKSSGLKIGKISYEYSDTVPKGEVIRTEPPSGSQIKDGQKVNIVISKGVHLIEMPNVIGMPYSIAKKQLVKLGFTVTKTEEYSGSPKNQVNAQDVEPGQQINPDKTTVTLLVSKGHAPASSSRSRRHTIKLRDIVGYSLKDAQDYAREHNLSLKVEEESSDEKNDGKVLRQSPQAGTDVSSGDTLTIVVAKANKHDEKSTSSNTTTTTTVTKSYTISYPPSSSQSDSQKTPDHIQVYVSDDDHSINNIYRDMNITSEQSFTVPFKLSKKNGHIKILRNGNTILDEDVNK